jgi:hypothetical protein
MHRPQRDDFQNEHVERALNEIRWLAHALLSVTDKRHPSNERGIQDPIVDLLDSRQ